MTEYITIPDQHYVGFVDRHEDSNILLGFAVPYGTDSASKKRISTVDNWRDENIEPAIYDNKLLEGFQVFRSNYRSYWGGANIVWRIVDPRGFQLEIESGNMENIIDCTTIENGLIKGKCIWGRSGSKNVLLPEASAPYQTAVKNTVVKNSVGVKLSSVLPGSLITLKNNEQVVYLGKFYVMLKETEKNTDTKTINCNRQYHFYADFDDSGVVKKHINLAADLKVSSIDRVELTADEAKQIVFNTKNYYSTFNSYSKEILGVFEKQVTPHVDLIKVSGPLEAFNNSDSIPGVVIYTLGNYYHVSGYVKCDRINIYQITMGNNNFHINRSCGLVEAPPYNTEKYMHTSSYRHNYYKNTVFSLVVNDESVIWYKPVVKDENGNVLCDLF